MKKPELYWLIIMMAITISIVKCQINPFSNYRQSYSTGGSLQKNVDLTAFLNSGTNVTLESCASLKFRQVWFVGRLFFLQCTLNISCDRNFMCNFPWNFSQITNGDIAYFFLCILFYSQIAQRIFSMVQIIDVNLLVMFSSGTTKIGGLLLAP